jgi:hypothetical protein
MTMRVPITGTPNCFSQLQPQPTASQQGPGQKTMALSQPQLLAKMFRVTHLSALHTRALMPSLIMVICPGNPTCLFSHVSLVLPANMVASQDATPFSHSLRAASPCRSPSSSARPTSRAARRALLLLWWRSRASFPVWRASLQPESTFRASPSRSRVRHSLCRMQSNPCT